MTETGRSLRALFLSGLLCFALLVSGVNFTGNVAGVGNSAVANAAGDANIDIAQNAVSQHADPTYNATFPSTDYQTAANTIRLNFHGTGVNFASDFPATVRSVSVDGNQYSTASTSRAGNGEHLDIELQRDIPVPENGGNVDVSVDMRNVKNPPTTGNYGYTVDLRSGGTTEVRAGGYLDIVQGTVVTGQITDNNGGQLAPDTANTGVVKFIDSAGNAEQRTVISQTGLNGAGNYGLSVPTNTDKIRANANGYAPTTSIVSISGTSNTADISLNDGATIEGTVTDADGNGVGGLTVFAQENQTGAIADRTTTAGNGVYSLSVNANLGKHAVVAGTQTQRREIGFKTNLELSNNSVTKTVDLTTPEKADNEKLTVTVSDPNGDSVTGANVIVRSSDYQHSGQALTDANGEATFEKPPGTYTVRADASDYPATTKRGVTLPEGNSETVEISFASSTTISGQVTDINGENAQGIRVLVSDGDQFYLATTKSDGTYTATVPADTEYTVSVLTKGKSAPPQTVTPSESGATGIDFELETTTIVGAGNQDSNTGAEIISGAGTDEDLAIGATLRSGLLRAKLYDTSEGNPGRGGGGAPADLSTLGVNDETEFKITLTVENFDPDALLWGIKDSSWEIQENPNEDYTDIVIEGKSTDIHATWTNGQGSRMPIGPVIERNPSEISWPTGQNAGADVGVDNTVYFGLYDLSRIPGPASSNLDGISTTTNAQAFAPPEFENDTLRVWVGAPSQRVNGTEHSGFYHADIPQSQLDDWGVTDPETELQVSYKNSQADYEVTDTATGARVEINNLGYSAFAVAIEPDDSAINNNNNDNSNGGGGGGGDDEEEEPEESEEDANEDSSGSGDGPTQVIDIGAESEGDDGDEGDGPGITLITDRGPDNDTDRRDDADGDLDNDSSADDEFGTDIPDDEELEDEQREDEEREGEQREQRGDDDEEEEFVRIAQTSVERVEEGETVTITNLSSVIGDVPSDGDALDGSDDNGTGLNETGANETSLNETVVNETDLNETGANETDVNETGINETALNETGVNETDLNETGVNETELNETGVNETDLNETGVNETAQNETTPSGNETGPGATIEDLNITFDTSQSDVTVEAGVNSTAGADTGEPEQGETIEYLQIDTSANDSDISKADFDIRVSESEREQLGVSPDNVVVYRYHNETWQDLNTSHVGDDRYKVTTPGFSVFAVGTNVRYENTDINVTRIQPGEQFAGLVDVTNNGRIEVSANLTLEQGTRTVSRKPVTVPANATKRVRIPATVATAGQYRIAINGEDAGVLQVTTPQTDTPEVPTPSATDTATSEQMTTTGDGGPGFGFVAALVAAVIVGVVGRRRSS